MVLFGSCKSTVDCKTVSYILQKLLTDKSTQSKMFKMLLSDWGLMWNFGQKDGLCYIQGSWEAMLKGYTIFTAVQKASDYPEIYHDLGLLYQWSTDYCETISKADTSSELGKYKDTLACTNSKDDSILDIHEVDKPTNLCDEEHSLSRKHTKHEDHIYASNEKVHDNELREVKIEDQMHTKQDEETDYSLSETHLKKRVLINKKSVVDRLTRQLNFKSTARSRSRGSNRFKCSVCDRVFSSKTVLKKHSQIHARVKCITCDDCGRKFYNKHHLHMHARVHNKYKKVLPKRPQQKPIEEQLGDLVAHMVVIRKTLSDDEHAEASRCLPKIKHPSIPVAHLIKKTLLDSGFHRYQCKKCNYTNEGKDTNTIRDHIRRNHLDIPPLYNCSKCDKKYKIKKDLNRHMKTHTMSFACTLCNKQYDYKLSLHRHMKTEHNSAPVFRPLCQTCGKDFVNNTALKYHMQRNHMGEREVYMCEICGKKLLTPSGHKKHLKAHVEGPKRETHPCDTCGEVLGSKIALKYHIQAKHSDARDFSCHVCGKSFKVRNVYNNHIKIHEERTRFECMVCTKSFLNRFSLRNHMLTHTEQKGRYSCDQPGCDKAYSGRKGLRKHLLRNHNITMTPGKSGRPTFHSANTDDSLYSRERDGCDTNLAEKAIIIKHIPGTKTVTGNVRKEYIMKLEPEKVEKRTSTKEQSEATKARTRKPIDKSAEKVVSETKECVNSGNTIIVVQ